MLKDYYFETEKSCTWVEYKLFFSILWDWYSAQIIITHANWLTIDNLMIFMEIISNVHISSNFQHDIKFILLEIYLKKLYREPTVALIFEWILRIWKWRLEQGLCSKINYTLPRGKDMTVKLLSHTLFGHISGPRYKLIVYLVIKFYLKCH